MEDSVVQVRFVRTHASLLEAVTGSLVQRTHMLALDTQASRCSSVWISRNYKFHHRSGAQSIDGSTCGLGMHVKCLQTSLAPDVALAATMIKQLL